MLKDFLIQLEKRPPLEHLLFRFRDLFEAGSAHEKVFSAGTFEELTGFLEQGEASFQAMAVQAGVRWSTTTQRVALRNKILKRGFLTPSCLWAYREMRGHQDELFRDYASADMCFMQIILLKETEPERAVPFLVERFVARKNEPEELRSAARLCVLRLLDSAASQELVRSFQSRYPSVELLFQWRPSIPGRHRSLGVEPRGLPVDFSQLVRSVHDLRELSSLTRTVYLVSSFYVPLSDKEWRSLWLTGTDELFFHRLRAAGVVESFNGGSLLSADLPKRNLVRKFLYEKYSLAKESVSKKRAERRKEERERKVRNAELDRQALEIVPDGIICVDGSGLLYYVNPAAEELLTRYKELRERIFGGASLEVALKEYSRERVMSRIRDTVREDDHAAEVFGDRISIAADGRRFELNLGRQVILIRDTTDQHLIDEEVGKLYRHELKAALDVMGAGIAGVKELTAEGKTDEALEMLDQVEKKRSDLFAMLEDRIDFIRLHSDLFQIRPSTVNLNLVVDTCMENYREAASAREIEIRSNHLHSSAVMVRGEERYLVRLLDNIIRNALKFSCKGSKIEVKVGSAGFEAFVAVQDAGPGIPPENLGRIFQLGFTTGGSGRGLYLARRIAEAHQGRIDVKSRAGQGACFTVMLPLVTEG
jgi:signal transduction histidine kinase